MLPAQLVLDRGQQVCGFLIDQVKVGIARHTEWVLADDLHPREQLTQVQGDHVLERNEPLTIGQGYEAGQERRHLDPGKAHVVPDGVADHHGEVQREVRDVGKGVRRIHGQRCEDGKDPRLEFGGEVVAICIVEIANSGNTDTLLLQGRGNPPRKELRAAVQQGARPLVDGAQLLTGGHAVGRGLGKGCVHLLLEAGDPDLEKLVHALAEDGEEAHAFQQRQRLILGDRQDAVVEIELR